MRTEQALHLGAEGPESGGVRDAKDVPYQGPEFVVHFALQVAGHEQVELERATLEAAQKLTQVYTNPSAQQVVNNVQNAMCWVHGNGRGT
jgi:hypothetical protein